MQSQIHSSSQQLPPVEQLVKIIQLEAQATESFLDLLIEQQEALTGLLSSELEVINERCEETQRRIRALENDRLRILARSMKGTPSEKFIGTPFAFERFFEVMDNRGGVKMRLKEARERLRVAVASVIQRNAVNRIIMEHSMNYAKHNLRLITSEFSRQLIDQKI